MFRVSSVAFAEVFSEIGTAELNSIVNMQTDHVLLDRLNDCLLHRRAYSILCKIALKSELSIFAFDHLSRLGPRPLRCTV